jgi:hypothetical protein
MIRKVCAALAAAATLSLNPAFAAMADFTGSWDSTNMRSGGLAELDIAFSGGTVTVRAAGQCSPNPCEWGEEEAEPLLPPRKSNIARDTAALIATFEVSGISQIVLITAPSRGRLSVTVMTSYPDARPSMIMTETMQPVSRGEPVAEPVCKAITPPLRIRLEGGAWAVRGGAGTVAQFASPEQAGFLRFLLQVYGPDQLCTWGEPGASVQILSRGGALPSGAQPGEDCIGFDWRRLAVSEESGGALITDGRSRMAMLPTVEEAEAVVDILRSQRAAAQCFIGRPNPGLSYFRR